MIKRPESSQLMPKDAKCVHKGIIFDTYQWQQKQFDGTFATFEKLKRMDTVSLLPVLDDGKIILAKQEQPNSEPFIGTIGGRIEEGEDPLDAAEREMLEESGYSTNKLILWNAVQPLSKIDWAIYTFIAKGCKKVADLNLDSGEKIELLFLTFDEFVEISTENDNFRDNDIALIMLKAKQKRSDLEEMKKLFLG